MEQMTLGQRISSLFSVIMSSPFFLILFIVLMLTILLLIVNAKANNPTIKLICSVIYSGISLFIVIKYWSSVSSLCEELLDNIFTVLYFPNYISYICILIVSVLFFVISLINSNVSKIYRIVNIFAFVLLAFLFVLTIDVVTKNGINIYDKVSVYSNETLVTLIQSSMGVFFIWFAILLVDTIVNFIIKMDDSKYTAASSANSLVIEGNKVLHGNAQGGVSVNNLPNSSVNMASQVSDARLMNRKIVSSIKDFAPISDDEFMMAYNNRKSTSKLDEIYKLISED